MNKLITLLIIIITAVSSFAQIKLDFNTVYNNAERNPKLRIAAENLAISKGQPYNCLLYTSPSPRDRTRSRMPSSA